MATNQRKFYPMPGKCVPALWRVTATVIIDSLKAGVIQADWYDPQLNPILLSLPLFKRNQPKSLGMRLERA
jgi:hypothetical protein